MSKIPGLDWLERLYTPSDGPGVSTLRLERERLKRVRGVDVSAYSDVELREALAGPAQQLHGRPAEDPDPELFAMVFSVVIEAISRRQGAWGFFEPGTRDGDLRSCSLQAVHGSADRISQDNTFKHALSEWQAGQDDGWESYYSRVSPVLARQGLEPWEMVLVGTVLYVRQRRQVQYSAEIMLPATFYQTLRSHDGHGELAFEPTDEQILGGILLYQGKIVEMNAGEGKTIAAVFPAVLHAVHGRAVHVITANDYLAGRDAEWLAPVFESLGLSVSAVLEVMEESERRIAYGKDIVYGALREFGFDFMRDNLQMSSAEVVQRGLDVAIVDEADHALIDEANIPLIIAGGAGEVPKIPAKLRAAIERLASVQSAAAAALEREAELQPPGSDARLMLLARLYLADPHGAALQQEIALDPRCFKRLLRVIADCRVDDEYESLTGSLVYWIDDDGRSLCLTAKGTDLVETLLGPIFDDADLQARLSDIQADGDISLASRRKQAREISRRLARKQDRMHQIVRMIWGYALLKKDVDYLVRDDRVVLIDKYTGRGRPDTRYHYGLQAALEVKEGVPVQPEHEVLGQISVRGFMSQYGTVCGMTGTAMSSKSEFKRAYGLDVIAVGPSKAVKRTDLEPRMYLNKQDKLEAMLEEVRFCRQVGRPVLIGTHSIDDSDAISGLLRRHGIAHNLLNAANDLEEERVISDAGRFGAVTVATDMAGRGTDIILEAGLDRRIAGSHVGLVCDWLAQGAGAVILSCASEEAAEILVSAIGSDAPGLRAAVFRDGDGTRVTVTAQDGPVSGETVTLDFGLGLLVIGMEASDNARVDRQLMGRSGRQGAFGASRFFLSSDDKLLNARGGARPGQPTSASAGPDSAGRDFREGPALNRHLEELQKNAETDAASRRARAEEYTRVFEAQSFAYYRSRRELLGVESFAPRLDRLVAAKAGQLAKKHFPGKLVDDYGLQFAGLSEELELDYGVAAASLWGLDLGLLENAIAGLLDDRLDRARERFSGGEFDRLGTLLYLKVSDELWKHHIAHVQDLVMSTQLCGDHGSGGMAAFTLLSFESYEEFQSRIMDEFLPKLAAFPRGTEGKRRETQVDIFEEVSQILA